MLKSRLTMSSKKNSAFVNLFFKLLVCLQLICFEQALAADIEDTTSYHQQQHDKLFPKRDVRIGILAHNKGPIASQTENGPDLTSAFHYRLNQWNPKNIPVALYAHGGAVINLSSGTSYVYGGLNSRTSLFSPNWFIELGGGFAVHNGEIKVGNPNKRELGSRILFRLESTAGYRFDNQWELGFMFDHVSNGSILNNDDNKGLDTYGLRLHIPF